MPSVLFVCTANQFRSPLAAAIFAQALAREEQERTSAWEIGPAADWQVGSAGTWAPPGLPVLPDVLEAGRQLGVDLSGHRSQMVSRPLLAGYDLVLAMQDSHRELLQREYPQLRERIYLLSLVLDYGSYDFPDTHRFLKEVLYVGRRLDELICRNLAYICVLAKALHNRHGWVSAQPGGEVEYTARQLLKRPGGI